MRCPFCTELLAKVNAETIHEATEPLASLLELKSLCDPVGLQTPHHSNHLQEPFMSRSGKVLN